MPVCMQTLHTVWPNRSVQTVKHLVFPDAWKWKRPKTRRFRLGCISFRQRALRINQYQINTIGLSHMMELIKKIMCSRTCAHTCCCPNQYNYVWKWSYVCKLSFSYRDFIKKERTSERKIQIPVRPGLVNKNLNSHCLNILRQHYIVRPSFKFQARLCPRDS